MRIVSWNCNGAFRNKYEMIAGYQPDVVVAPESESPKFLARTEQNIPCSSHIWDGESAYKGLSVFTFNGYKAYLPDFYSKKFKLTPIAIACSALLLSLKVSATDHPFPENVNLKSFEGSYL